MPKYHCTLPGGYVDDAGRVMRDVTLLPLSGFSERLIAEKRCLSLPALTTALLAGCIGRIGDRDDVSPGMVRSLLVGDRQYLLLKLREITFGSDIRGIIRCSWPDCGAKMDIDFPMDRIPVKSVPQTGRLHTMRLAEASGPREITFRLPDGNDREALCRLVEENETAAADMLLARCIQDVTPADIAVLAPATKRAVEEAMKQLAPSIELSMEAFCPECRRPFVAFFDLERFILDELRTNLDLLLQEVHYLAFHYHWSEQEILGMSRENRRRYIDILSAHMEQMHDAR